MLIPGYQIHQTIYQGLKTIVYRATRTVDDRAVVIKIPSQPYPQPREIARFKHQYELTKNLEIEGIVKPIEVIEFGNNIALIMENSGGVVLNGSIEFSFFQLEKFLSIAIQLAETLGQLHHHHVIHKDIKPQNILINSETGRVKLIDFSIATQLERDTQNAVHPTGLEGTLAYLSPEQTGRMNRVIDYRTDFYSLGVTLYELLCGQLPHQSSDPMELLHCHIAKQPVPPNELLSKIPAMVSAIVMKLLAKMAEDRYQSGFGLKADLEECLRQLQTSGAIAEFPLGRFDISQQLLIPQKLYGRAQSVAHLLQSFARTAAGATEMMLVAGYSGIGKSVLIREIHKPIVAARSYFISGKFDLFKRNIPYSALIDAFSQLIRQLLTESDDRLQDWRTQLLEALGTNGQVIIDVIPEVELLIGPQPPVLNLGPAETQNRFNLVFDKFLGVFTQKEHPIAIFLDDLQWADLASLQFIKRLMFNPNSHYLLIIGAYRDNEVDATHPLMQSLAEIQDMGAVVNEIILQPLEVQDVTQLLADALTCPLERVQPLGELLTQKTGGNPFFLTQLLQSLYSDHLLTFDLKAGMWQWDISCLHQVEITDNVVDLMTKNLQGLAENTQKILQIAACIGHTFDLKFLAVVYERSQLETAREIWPSVQAGFMIPLSENYQFFDELETNPVEYKFLHDRVQQAAYGLIPESQKKAVHLKIGQLLLESTPLEQRSDKIFEIVNQLNISADLLTEISSTKELARLNLIAAKKAKAATAYQAAISYLRRGREFLQLDSWQTDYDLIFEYYLESIETEFVNRDFDEALRLYEFAYPLTQNHLDRVKLSIQKLKINIAKNEFQEAVEFGCLVLNELGLSLSQQPPENLAIAELVDLPLMTEPEKIAALQLLNLIHPPAAISGHPVTMPLIFTMLSLSLDYGNSPPAIYAYAVYSLILCGWMNEIERGYQLAQVAMQLVHQLNAKELIPQTYNILGTNILHWKEHTREAIAALDQSIQSSWEFGNFEFLCHSEMFLCDLLFFTGQPLEVIAKRQVVSVHTLTQLKQDYQINYATIGQQCVASLQGHSENQTPLVGEHFDETQKLSYFLEIQNFLCLFAVYFYKAIFHYLMNPRDRRVLETIILARQYSDAIKSMVIRVECEFYHSLALLAAYPDTDEGDRLGILATVGENQQQLEIWAHHAPMNFQHKYDLVAAEIARVSGEPLLAMELYDRAIAGAAEQGYIQDEAIAYERASEFYHSLGRAKIAQDYLLEGYYRYIRWGAQAKVSQLEGEHPELNSRINNREAKSLKTLSLTPFTGQHITEELDFSTVIKSSQAISGEIVLEQLLKKLMQILIENAGAEQGFLILPRNQQLFIEAMASNEDETSVMVRSLPLEESLTIPSSLVQYVQRTKESVVLSDALNSGQFTTDATLVRREVKSVLCTPIVNQGNLLAIIYLENNLSTDAFTSQRLEIVQILSSQAAIALENSLLYQTLEEKVIERTQQLAAANQEIQELNKQLKSDNLRMRAELEVTRQLQQMMLPTAEEIQAIPGLDIAGFMEPADEIGGDYYDLLQEGDQIKFAIGDVTGHGLESGVVMIMVQTAVRTLIESQEINPSKFLDILNRTIYKNVQRIKAEKSMTLAVLDYENGRVKISGQHEEILIVRQGGIVERIDTVDLGFPIGLISDMVDFVASETVELQPGDGVVLYTDGITEAADINNVQYGLDRLCEVICQNWQFPAEEILQAAIADLRVHIGTQKVYDDITLVVIKQK
ncbi:AAA family ATPase [Laspinema sp. D1]|uniref:AAA family ATPase n=1 Tax=Laspinema palackyanum D2a TaxID=2953684 RepID=A0ABT2MSY0_9CYAN|nr:AAA family ATPase [Laspinema sp. D2a]